SALRMAAAGVVAGALGVGVAVWLLARFLQLHDIGWVAVGGSTLIIAGIAIAASSFPAWRAARLSPMAANPAESQWGWQSARSGIGRAFGPLSQAMADAAGPAAMSESSLLADLVASTRHAASSAEQLQIALSTLQSCLGAQSVRLMEKKGDGEYR